jgi:hypothetical protein
MQEIFKIYSQILSKFVTDFVLTKFYIVYQVVMLHALVQFFYLTFVMKNKKNFPNAQQR